MIKNKGRVSILAIALLGVFAIPVYAFLRQPPGHYLSVIQESPFCKLIHYKWDISEQKDESVVSTLYVDDEMLTIKITGSGKMIDFIHDDKEKAWHGLKNMVTGWCFRLDNLIIDRDVIYIGQYAFPDFTQIETVVFPKSLAEIGHGAFINCTSLKIVNYEGTKEEWKKVKYDDSCFKGTKVDKIICTDGYILL